MVAFYKGMEFQLKSIKYCIIIIYYVNVLSDECRHYIKVDVILNIKTVKMWFESLKKKDVKMLELLRCRVFYH